MMQLSHVGVEVGFAWPGDRNQVPAAVIVKGHVQRLMNVADPMPKALEEPELVAYVEAEGKIPRVVQDCGDDAAIGNRARMRNLDPLRGARQVHIMLGRPLARKHIRPGAAIGEGAELRIDRDQRIDAGFNLRLQLLIGDLADDAVPNVTPSEGGRRIENRA